MAIAGRSFVIKYLCPNAESGSVPSSGLLSFGSTIAVIAVSVVAGYVSVSKVISSKFTSPLLNDIVPKISALESAGSVVFLNLNWLIPALSSPYALSTVAQLKGLPLASVDAKSLPNNCIPLSATLAW